MEGFADGLRRDSGETLAGEGGDLWVGMVEKGREGVRGGLQGGGRQGNLP